MNLLYLFLYMIWHPSIGSLSCLLILLCVCSAVPERLYDALLIVFGFNCNNDIIIILAEFFLSTLGILKMKLCSPQSLQP